MAWKNKEDVYQTVTDKIVALLEKGVAPWKKPWTGGERPRNLITDNAYHGFNRFMLQYAVDEDYKSPYFLTYNQARGLGGYASKGETGWPITYFEMKKYKTGDMDDDGNVITKRVPMIKKSTVFNLDQCSDVKVPKGRRDNIIETYNHDRVLTKAQGIIDAMEPAPRIQHGPKARYFPGPDIVEHPPKENFSSLEHYYATVFHELIHWTGHSTRLDRLGRSKFRGDEDYSQEELAAEMGSAFLCADAGIVDDTVEQSASYINGWLNKLRSDKKFLVGASSQAEKATSFIHGG